AGGCGAGPRGRWELAPPVHLGLARGMGILLAAAAGAPAFPAALPGSRTRIYAGPGPMVGALAPDGLRHLPPDRPGRGMAGTHGRQVRLDLLGLPVVGGR